MLLTTIKKRSLKQYSIAVVSKKVDVKLFYPLLRHRYQGTTITDRLYKKWFLQAPRKSVTSDSSRSTSILSIDFPKSSDIRITYTDVADRQKVELQEDDTRKEEQACNICIHSLTKVFGHLWKSFTNCFKIFNPKISR